MPARGGLSSGRGCRPEGGREAARAQGLREQWGLSGQTSSRPTAGLPGAQRAPQIQSALPGSDSQPPLTCRHGHRGPSHHAHGDAATARWREGGGVHGRRHAVGLYHGGVVDDVRGRRVQGLRVVRALLGERQMPPGLTPGVRAPTAPLPTCSAHGHQGAPAACTAYLCVRALLGVGTSHGVHGRLVGVGGGGVRRHRPAGGGAGHFVRGARRVP